jgi:hypothetical protein
MLAWILPRGAGWAVHLAGLGYTLLTVYALQQAFGGRARFDWTPESGGVLLAGGVALGIATLYALCFGRLTRTRPSGD